MIFGNLVRKCSRESKVANLNVTVSVQKNICWFDVSVNHVSRMYEIKRAKEVVEDLSDCKLRYRELILAHNSL